MIAVKFVAVIVIGYLLGSIPFGALIAKRRINGDVRQLGSGRTGATNVLRTVGKKAGAAVAVLDVVKGLLAVIIAGLIFGRSYLVIGDVALGVVVAQVMAALAAMVGHTWPVFLKFHGGRGVATYFGGLIALYPPAALFGVEVLVVCVGLTRFVSLGSIVATVSTCAILVPLVIVNNYPIEYLIYAFIGTVAIIIMHRDNINRLITGKERKLGEKVEPGDFASI